MVLTDNCEQLVEVLEAHTGERATVLEAVDEEIGPDIEPVRIPPKLPARSPRREWTELEEKARAEGTILFRVEGYEGLIGGTRRLDERFPDLPAPVPEVVDGLLAYDRGCREGDGGAAEFLGLLDVHDERRRTLEEEAETAGCPVAGVEGCRAWRKMSERLVANGRALLEDAGERAGEAGPEIAGRLGRLTETLHVDDGVVQFLEALLEEAAEAALGLGRLPEREEALVADTICEERARLRDPDAGHEFLHRWPGKEMLVEGDRLRIAYHPDLPDGELAAVSAGLAGGLAPDDRLELEWISSEPKRSGPYVDIHAEDLAKGAVRRADWSHEELRNAALMRERPASSKEFSRLCNGDVVAGDLLCWNEYATPDPSAENRLAGTGRKAVVHVEAELLDRRAALLLDADICVQRETARSDDRPCGERTLPLARLTAGGCLRASWIREEDREAEALVQGRRLGEERQELWREELEMGRHWAMRLSLW